MSSNKIDLVAAAAELQLPYSKAYRLVLIGALKGERQEGRWLVDRADLERLLKERERARDHHAAPAR